MKKLFYFVISIILLSSILFNANIEKISAASKFIDGVIQTGKGVGYNMENDLSLAERIGQVLLISTTFLGVVFLGLMIYGGYIWMMARGNEQEVARAKNIIIYAVIGLAVVLAAYAITSLFNELWIKSKN